MSRRTRKRAPPPNLPNVPLRRSKRLQPNVPPETLFEDINDNCLKVLFNHLDVKSLYSMASMNQRFLDIARHTFAESFVESTKFRVVDDEIVAITNNEMPISSKRGDFERFFLLFRSFDTIHSRHI